MLDPREPFNVVTFQQMAKEALGEIYGHGRIPVIAGGTGFYIQALQKPEMSQVEKKALYYGINALLRTTDERS